MKPLESDRVSERWPHSGVRRILIVAALTFREARRRWVVVAAFVMTLGLLVLYGLGLYYAGQELSAGPSMGGGLPDEIVHDLIAGQLLYMGLFMASFIVGLIAVFASVGSISSELDTGVLHAVLTRPIRRAELVLGKWLGIALMLTVYSLGLVGAITGLATWLIDAPMGNLPGALALFILQPLVLLSLAMLGSTRLPTLANGVLCTTAFGIGFVGGVIEQIGSVIRNETMMNLGIVSSLVMPFDAMHRKAVSLLVPTSLLAQGRFGIGPGAGPSATPSAWMIVYSVGYVAFALWLGTRVFGKRDL